MQLSLPLSFLLRLPLLAGCAGLAFVFGSHAALFPDDFHLLSIPRQVRPLVGIVFVIVQLFDADEVTQRRIDRHEVKSMESFAGKQLSGL